MTRNILLLIAVRQLPPRVASAARAASFKWGYLPVPSFRGSQRNLETGANKFIGMTAIKSPEIFAAPWQKSRPVSVMTFISSGP
jgi:hypothetical protein